jgi:hypothetical protein
MSTWCSTLTVIVREDLGLQRRPRKMLSIERLKKDDDPPHATVTRSASVHGEGHTCHRR